MTRVSRRELLQSLAALTAVSCSGRFGGRSIAGSIVGGSHVLGHRLRDGFRPTPTRREAAGIVILGAGIAGLSAAWALERAGLRDYLVLELEDAAGGTARSGSNAVSAYPWAAHYVPVPPRTNRPLVALLEEVGAVAGHDAAGAPIYAEQILCRDPQERLFFRGEWYEGLYPRVGASSADLAELAAFEKDMRRFAGWRDAQGRRGFAVPRDTGSAAAEIRALDGLSMAEYLTGAGWASPRLRWFVEYGCRDDFGASLRQTSAWAGVHYFAARRAEEGAENAEFLTWPEGNGHLVAHLAGVVGSRLRTRALVTAVTPGPEAVDVTYLDATRGEALGIRASHAIFALPRFLAAHLVTPWQEKVPAHLAETVYGSWMVANLTLSDRPESRGFPLAWDNVLYDSPSLGYVVATHQTGRDTGPTVWTYYLPLIDDDPRRARAEMLARPWEEWVALILKDLGRSHPGLRALVDSVDVYLWGHAMVRPRPGFMWSDALAASAQPLGRLHFAHTDLSGMALFEEAQRWGIRAAEAILHDRKATFDSWL